MTGQRIKLGKGYSIKDGKLIKSEYYRDASHAIRAKKSKKVRVGKKVPT